MLNDLQSSGTPTPQGLAHHFTGEAPSENHGGSFQKQHCFLGNPLPGNPHSNLQMMKLQLREHVSFPSAVSSKARALSPC